MLINRDGTGSQLYDLENDPGENMDLSSKYPEIVNRLTDQALKWRTSLPEI
ncbi:MAG: hypothetical protein RR346_00980 [Bacteroidales bacterium]